MHRLIRVVLLALTTCLCGLAHAQGKVVTLGVLYDMTGSLATSGGYPSYLGTKYAIDMFNARGGVDGYKIKPIYVDAQSKVDVAINEAERLISQEKVDALLGIFSSSQCVPIAQRADASKTFLWPVICTSSAVFKNKNLKYVFRVQAHSDQFGPSSCDFLRDNAKAKLNKDPKDLKVAIVYEDSPYGVGASAGQETACKDMQIVLKEGYSNSTPDLSTLVTKLKRARPDVILHTGQNQDITLFLRQAKEQGLKWQALIGHGAGYGLPDKLYAAVGKDADYIFDTEPVGADLIDQSKLQPGLAELYAEVKKRYRAENNNAEFVPSFVSMGFSATWVFLNDVLPRAIKQGGTVNAETLRNAALATDIPTGGTIQGFGVKFLPPGDPMAGQNARATMPTVQYINEKPAVVAPRDLRSKEPVLPTPAPNAFAAH